MELILKAENISKYFPGTKALDDVQFDLYKGEVHALIGENGAGKSTLMKILLGIYQQDAGDIIFKGEKINFRNPKMALTHGISMIHQEISLVPDLDIAENIWLGRENLFTRMGIIDLKQRLKVTRELLEHLEIKLDPKEIIRELSVANMQLVEIARAVSYDSKVIIMDEPTSALTDKEIDKLYKIIRELKNKGVSIIFISHKIEEIFEICDRITVLCDGKYISTDYANEITKDELISKIVGRTLNEMFPKEEAPITDIVLEVRNLCGEKFDNISFKLRKGEILGFCGLMGAGRTEIMRGLFGIDAYTSGEILVDGKMANISKPKHAIDLGFGMITEDRLRQGSLHMLPVKENFSIAYLRSISNNLRFFNSRKETRDCEEMVDQLNVSLSSLMQLMSSLSGGNQQKVIIGRWMLTKPKILIMDEPTRGIDVGAKSEIHRLLSQLAKEGMAIIMISSEMPEILGMSDRIIVVRSGQLVGEFARDEANQELLMSKAFGVS